jgi:alpha-beta hydrolase superfamily lysophospholipase
MKRRLVLCALLALAACSAPSVQPPGPRAGEPALTAEAVVTRDGLALPLRVWPAAGEPRAIAIALHGFNDYSNAFAEPAAWWAARGVSVYAYDQRGFGRSPHRGLWPGVEALTGDLADAVALVRARHPGRPLYLVGESMGAAVIMAAMAGPGPPAADGLVLAAPAVWGRATMGWLYRELLEFFARHLPWYPLSGRDINILPSDNIEMLRALGRDPLVIKETRADAVWGLVNLMDAALAAAPGLAAPTLLLYGKRDELIPRAPVERMLAALAAPHRVALYAEGWHMLFRDLQRETVWGDVLAWMRDPAAPLPSGAERTDRPLFAAH